MCTDESRKILRGEASLSEMGLCLCGGDIWGWKLVWWCCSCAIDTAGELVDGQ